MMRLKLREADVFDILFNRKIEKKALLKEIFESSK